MAKFRPSDFNPELIALKRHQDSRALPTLQSIIGGLVAFGLIAWLVDTYTVPSDPYAWHFLPYIVGFGIAHLIRGK